MEPSSQSGTAPHLSFSQHIAVLDGEWILRNRKSVDWILGESCSNLKKKKVQGRMIRDQQDMQSTYRYLRTATAVIPAQPNSEGSCRDLMAFNLI